MVEPHRAPRQGVYPGTGGPHRLVFLVLTLLLLSAGVAIGIALPRWSKRFYARGRSGRSAGHPDAACCR